MVWPKTPVFIVEVWPNIPEFAADVLPSTSIFYLFIYLLINIKIDKSVIPHQCISVINEADIVLNKKEIIK